MRLKVENDLSAVAVLAGKARQVLVLLLVPLPENPCISSRHPSQKTLVPLLIPLLENFIKVRLELFG